MKRAALLILVIVAFLLSFSLVVCSSEEDDDGRDDDTGDDDADDDDTDDDDTDDDDTDDDTDDDDTDDDDTGETTISGSITYTGEYAGSSSGKNVYVFIFDTWPTPPGYPPICGTQASVSAGGFPVNYGPFECPAISKGQYYPFSYLDYNGNGSFDNTTEPVDTPSAAYPVTINPGDDKDIDFNLIDTTCSNPATVSGTISYTGTYSGSSEGKKVYVTIYDQPIGSGPPVYNNSKTVPGGGFPFNYSFNNVCLNGNFYPAAYLDYNGNNQFDLGTEPWDPYDDTVSITFGTTTDVDFTLQDTSK